MPLELRCHWMTGAGSPDAVTENVAVELTGALKLPEKPVIAGPVWANAGDVKARQAARANCNREKTARGDKKPDGFFFVLIMKVRDFQGRAGRRLPPFALDHMTPRSTTSARMLSR